MNSTIPGTLMISSFTESGEAVPGGIRKGVTIQIADETNRRIVEVDVDFEAFGRTVVGHTDVPCRIALGHAVTLQPTHRKEKP